MFCTRTSSPMKGRALAAEKPGRTALANTSLVCSWRPPSRTHKIVFQRMPQLIVDRFSHPLLILITESMGYKPAQWVIPSQTRPALFAVCGVARVWNPI
eukprot:2061994-Karenia_brevis.AAC.1